MRRFLTAAAVATALTATTAHAGAVSDPILEAEIIATDAATSSVDPQLFLVMLTALVVFAATN